MLRVAVFYDGNYFAKVNYFLKCRHERRHNRNAPLSIKGLHSFIEARLSDENPAANGARVDAAHHFRGYFANDSDERRESERRYCAMLTRQGVNVHRFELERRDGRYFEKGVDVALALEAYQAASSGQFDVVALVACDGDYVPLVEKIKDLERRVIVVGCYALWLTYEPQEARRIFTSRKLREESTYHMMLNEIVDGYDAADAPSKARIDGLFHRAASAAVNRRSEPGTMFVDEDERTYEDLVDDEYEEVERAEATYGMDDLGGLLADPEEQHQLLTGNPQYDS